MKRIYELNPEDWYGPYTRNIQKNKIIIMNKKKGIGLYLYTRNDSNEYVWKLFNVKIINKEDMVTFYGEEINLESGDAETVDFGYKVNFEIRHWLSDDDSCGWRNPLTSVESLYISSFGYCPSYIKYIYNIHKIHDSIDVEFDGTYAEELLGKIK